MLDFPIQNQSFMQQLFTSMRYSITSEKCNSIPCYKIDLTTDDRKIWISKETFLPVKIWRSGSIPGTAKDLILEYEFLDETALTKEDI